MRLWALVLLLAVACAPVSEAPEETSGRYQRPDFAALWRTMEFHPEERPEDYADAGNVIEKLASSPKEFRAAYRAVWAGVAKAEEKGLLELYGIERADTGEGSYGATFFIRTREGVSCLYANGDLHKVRSDKATVPTHPVSIEAFDLLRRRVAIEIPFRVASSMRSPVDDGSWVLLHVYRKGESHAALWYAPIENPDFTREGELEYATRHPILAVQSALWAAAPHQLFPRKEPPPDDFPEEDLWQFDDREVYSRTPGYE